MESRNGSPDASSDRLRELYAQLGEVLYERTKDDEASFLLAPSLYLSIAEALREESPDR